MKVLLTALLASAVLFLYTNEPIAKTWLIRSDGTGDVPTIQAGIDSAVAGDVVLLAAGTFTGAGNRNINFNGKAITVQSHSGYPDLCIIDCEELDRGFLFNSNEGPGSVLDDLTITNGSASFGAGEYIGIYLTNPTLMNCRFENNSATSLGGGMYINGAPNISF